MRKGILIAGIVLLVIGAPLAMIGNSDVANYTINYNIGLQGSVYYGDTEYLIMEAVGGVMAFIGVILVIVGAILKPSTEKALSSGVHTESLKELDDKLLKGEISKRQYKKLKKTILK